VVHPTRTLAALLALAPACTWDWDSLEPPRPLGAAGAWVGTFAEECTGATIDRTRWNTTYVHKTTTFRRYDWDNAGVADENVTVGGGLCTIAIEDRASSGAMYTSGVLDSSHKFEQAYGFFEVRARVPAGAGLGSSVDLSWTELWPPQINLLDVRGVQPTLNSPAAWYDDGTSAPTKNPRLAFEGADLSAGFHVFGLDWSAGGLVFYQDGVEIGRLVEPARFIDQPLRFEITTHVGVAGSGGPDATTPFPAKLEIDYVRAWRRR
jgi:beta-glucanase (GH16 family)